MNNQALKKLSEEEDYKSLINNKEVNALRHDGYSFLEVHFMIWD